MIRCYVYEALAIIIAAVLTGALIGRLKAVTRTLQFNLFTEMPFVFTFPCVRALCVCRVVCALCACCVSAVCMCSVLCCVLCVVCACCVCCSCLVVSA